MQWFRVPPKIFFEKDSITYLRHIEADRVMLVCDPGMVQFGYADLVKRQLEHNRHRPAVDVFSDVELNPSTNTVGTFCRLPTRCDYRSWWLFCNGCC